MSCELCQARGDAHFGWCSEIGGTGLSPKDPKGTLLLERALAKYRAATAETTPSPPSPAPARARVTRTDTNNGWFKSPRSAAPANPSLDNPESIREALSLPSTPTTRRAPSKPQYEGEKPGREMSEEYRKLALELIDQGWTYYRRSASGKGKPYVLSPDGAHKYILPNTPSDWRGVKNTRTYLRRLGANV